MKLISLAQMDTEVDYINRIKKYDKVIVANKDAMKEGFEFFSSKKFLDEHSKFSNPFLDMSLSGSFKNLLSQSYVHFKYLKPMQKVTHASFVDVEGYVGQLEQTGHPPKSSEEIIKNFPNLQLWEELKRYALNKWNLHVGFTKLPKEVIFKDKAVLFEYSLVFIEEMVKEKIDLAPSFETSVEVQKKYTSLGLAVNNIARWLREKGIVCQSNHPLGGLVCTPPLAGKAGMGWQGKNGLLITPMFGQRQRIAPILIKEKIFEYTDNDDHKWIEKFCESCNKCQKECPADAINNDRVVSYDIRDEDFQIKTCTDRIKCYSYFKTHSSCAVCIKACPFSKGNNIYNKIKKSYMKKIDKENQ